ncbi:MAG: hypothetical protein ABIC19_04300 [Patescibacteria group bacterium]|nr:hypothetical protein [Patescibacteria group bacterium]
MEDESNIPESSGDWLSETKNWIQDNIRIVLSIVIVLAIALGVYSYSKRGVEEEQGQVAQKTEEETDLQKLIEEQEQELANEQTGETLSQTEQSADSQKPEETTEQPEEQSGETAIQPETSEPQATEEPAGETIISQSGDAFEVTAATGDSLTTLARSAVKQYLDINNDSTLSAEHKIYIEDYLAKKMGYSDYLEIGQTKSFSQNDISEAVSAAKTLTPSQLEHLKIYSQRVSNI